MYIQIPTFGIYRIILIVQSRYNATLENTSLFYDVCCKNAGGCFEVPNLSLTHHATCTAEATQGTSKGSHNLRIVFGVVTIVAGLVLIAIIVFRRKHKRRQPLSKERGKNGTANNRQKMVIILKKQKNQKMNYQLLF